MLLLFTDPKCAPCNALLPEIGTWQREHADRLTVAVVSRGDADANRAKSTEHGLKNVLLQQDREVSEAYQEAGTPGAVVVRPDGTIGSALAAGADAIRALVARTVGSKAAAHVPAPAVHPHVHSSNGDGTAAAATGRPSVVIGDPAPPVRLRDLKGRTVNLAGFRGSRTAVLFWNPGCGFCGQMLDDLKRWEADPPEGAPKVLIVSTGDAEANRAMGLRSTVVLEPAFEVGYSFGANGTPSAILVDEEGKIASELAVGGPAVLALLGAAQTQAVTNGGAPAGAKPGDPAPHVELPALDGRTMRLADFRGRDTLVLFWNPGCSFCARMLTDLRAWDADIPRAAPGLLVIATGTPETTREMRLRSPVLLDPDFSVASKFGANGTPMAVLVDAKGTIASDVVAGADAVLALARGETQAQERR